MQKLTELVDMPEAFIANAVVSAPATLADAINQCPISHHMLETTCTAEQVLAAACGDEPVCHQPYMMDYNGKSTQMMRAAADRTHPVYSMNYDRGLAYSHHIPTDALMNNSRCVSTRQDVEN
ncbi:DUF5078 domain-containing protein [Mycobacterium paraseoulense]|uniref:DUF5078 domain-containing protein n=1 Tax=Mycobacterium TaxID=1763 RepID=UPI001301F96C|nr:DUF5078 domain-containing protein [Mycobacterium paraseoulense]MCV7397967.1 DUF5078 domain-containing protein [Mycobacterium paraseoulense]